MNDGPTIEPIGPVMAFGYVQAEVQEAESGIRLYDLLCFSFGESRMFLGCVRLRELAGLEKMQAMEHRIGALPEIFTRIRISGGIERHYMGLLFGIGKLYNEGKVPGQSDITMEGRYNDEPVTFTLGANQDYYMEWSSEPGKIPNASSKLGACISLKGMSEKIRRLVPGVRDKLQKDKNNSLKLDWEKIEPTKPLALEQLDWLPSPIAEFEKRTGYFASMGALIS